MDQFALGRTSALYLPLELINYGVSELRILPSSAIPDGLRFPNSSILIFRTLDPYISECYIWPVYHRQLFCLGPDRRKDPCSHHSVHKWHRAGPLSILIIVIQYSMTYLWPLTTAEAYGYRYRRAGIKGLQTRLIFFSPTHF